MNDDNKYRFFLVDDDDLRDALKTGEASEDEILAAFEDAPLMFEFKSEIGIDAAVLDPVTRVNWSDALLWSEGAYRVANPDTCEAGATRLADLIVDSRRLAHVLARLYADTEIEMLDEDIGLLAEFLEESDTSVEISSESALEALGLFTLQLAESLQAAADHDAWLFVSAVPSIE